MTFRSERGSATALVSDRLESAIFARLSEAGLPILSGRESSVSYVLKEDRGGVTLVQSAGYRTGGGRTTRATRLREAIRGAVSEVLHVADPQHPAAVDPGLLALLAPLDVMVQQVRGSLSEAKVSSLVEVILPAVDPVGVVRSEIEAQNVAARIRFFETVPCYDNAALAESVGHASRNTSATGSRWKGEGKVFAVTHKGRDLFPRFQFRDGRPHPAVGAALAELPGRMSPWQVAFWFVSSNAWLDGRTPAELLDEADRVVEAARNEARTVLG